MNIKEYFNDKTVRTYEKLERIASYQSSIKDFYEKFIKKHVDKLFVDKRNNLIKWCGILEDYISSHTPIYWIRKFESGSGKAKINDNRRTGTTYIFDNSKNQLAAYSYISNFDAQELYNMILNVDQPHIDEFENLMLTGNYKFHYDNGDKSCEKQITSFQNLEHAKSLGVINRANLYLAHIIDTNGDYYPNSCFEFEIGNLSDWKLVSEQKLLYPNLNTLFSDDKKIRIEEFNGNKDELIKNLKARFFRFVHPFNYFIVPGKSYEINSILGKSKISIGEEKRLIYYVKSRIFNDYIKKDAILLNYYKNFEDTIMIEEQNKFSKIVDNNVLTKYTELGDNLIHIVYGTSVGEEGKFLTKLENLVSNVSHLYDIYENIDSSNKLKIKNITDDDGKMSESKLLFKTKLNYTDFLKNLYKKVKELQSKSKVEIILEQKSNTVSGKKNNRKGNTKNTNTENYYFEGNEYTKLSKLLLNLVLKYLKDNPNVKYDELVKVFDMKLLSKPLIRLAEDIASKDFTSPKRVFADYEIKLIDGNTVYINNQIQSSDLTKLKEIIMKLGYNLIVK